MNKKSSKVPKIGGANEISVPVMQSYNSIKEKLLQLLMALATERITE